MTTNRPDPRRAPDQIDQRRALAEQMRAAPAPEKRTPRTQDGGPDAA